ncbi:hypothetical protein K1719_002113 [Acacia pycnantha]|nr:hypothetical protein K1719_002113 [Acacia pycnantha]
MSLDQEDLKPCKTTLIGFNGEHSRPKGFIDLRFTLGTRDNFKLERVCFIVAEFLSPYNIILGRPTIHKWDMLVSTKHQKLKMVNNQGTVITVRGDQRESRQCYFETVRVGQGGPSSEPQIQYEERYPNQMNPDSLDRDVNTVELDLRNEELHPEPAGDLEDLMLGAPSRPQRSENNYPRNLETSWLIF